MIALVDWLTVATHFLTMSLFAVGGAIVLIPEFHRFFVSENHWLTDVQFASGIALAQAAPGPNALMLGMLGWNFGVNATPAGQLPYPLAIFGFYLGLICVLTPSSLVTYSATKWVQTNSHRISVTAFKKGLSTVVVGSILASSWLLVAGQLDLHQDSPTWLFTLFIVLIVWKTNVHVLILMGVGALIGACGLLGPF
jgi:chromate transporter